MPLCIGDEHILLKNNSGIIISLFPDLCFTLDSPGTPVPFMIVAFCSDAVLGTAMISGEESPALTMASRILPVYGDEEGVLGGILSGVNKGWCRPKDSSLSVSMERYQVLKNGCIFYMNCNGPDGAWNTFGKATYMFGLSSEFGDFFKNRMKNTDNPQEELRIMERLGVLLSYAPPNDEVKRYDALMKEAWAKLDPELRSIAPEPNFRFQGPEAGEGKTNFDYYPVRIDSLPKGWTARELLTEMRRDMNKFVDRGGVRFGPYPEDPYGNLLSLSLLHGASFLKGLRGSVLSTDVEGDAKSGKFRFSTVHTPLDLSHQVRGTREFGYFQKSDGSYVFYTSAVDRSHDLAAEGLPSWLITAAERGLTPGWPLVERVRTWKNPLGWAVRKLTPHYEVGDYLRDMNAYKQAEKLWPTFQEGVAQFVNEKGGAATAGEPFSRRFKIDYGC